ncbi:hypothetical protein BGZ58_006921 [Dissophora ornata]|nr:hypothetical protein BGZ58_006921 [Dissophora ornata]
MAHSGQYFQQVLTTSSHFVLYNSVFSGKLERLYEIQYSEKITKRLAVAGHFISPDPSTAKKYGMLKCKKRKVVATFICYCRDVTKQSSVIRHVQRDEFNTAASADKMVANARPIDITPPPWRDTLDKYFHEIKE